ncbi:hypothetical protein [Actinomadura rudentiformis]|uniref:SH3 domain-containing protein n=1 Tax=Actinomadura rudentiformis TaxID=359158 RepID=A0A6H9Z6Q6_9ACTN|nr:hypothetical protein [Actinomadura rudentiformis]KAB2350678.1 hypothetical protein F8566_06700 [Actinomadura rudentiformis]
MLSKKLFASLTLSAFAISGAMAVGGSTAEAATEPVCKFKVRKKPARVDLRKAVKKGESLTLGKPIGYLKALEETVGTCKKYKGWHLVGGHKLGQPEQVIPGAVWHGHLVNRGRLTN